MVRGRVELRLIEDKASRQVSFSKRRSGLLKKAQELSVLCDADVGLIIFSAKGKLYEFSSSNCMQKIIDRYQQFSDAERGVSKVQQDVLRPEKLSADSRTCFEALKFLPRLMNGTDFSLLNLDELSHLERELETALTVTMTRKTQLLLDMLNEVQEKGKAPLHEGNAVHWIFNQDQTKNGGINGAANGEGTQSGGGGGGGGVGEASNDNRNTSSDSAGTPSIINYTNYFTFIKSTMEGGSEDPEVYAEDRRVHTRLALA